jgi:hypothetical protein
MTSPTSTAWRVNPLQPALAQARGVPRVAATAVAAPIAIAVVGVAEDGLRVEATAAVTVAGTTAVGMAEEGNQSLGASF